MNFGTCRQQLLTAAVGLFLLIVDSLHFVQAANPPTVPSPVTTDRMTPAMTLRQQFKPKPKSTNAKTAVVEKGARHDYFVSTDTVIIGCTSGMAAGILVGSVPMAGAVMSGIGVPESVTLVLNLAGMGCGVGAVSSAVAILTAWILAPD